MNDFELIRNCTTLSECARILYSNDGYYYRQKIKKIFELHGLDWKDFLKRKNVNIVSVAVLNFKVDKKNFVHKVVQQKLIINCIKNEKGKVIQTIPLTPTVYIVEKR